MKLSAPILLTGSALLLCACGGASGPVDFNFAQTGPLTTAELNSFSSALIESDSEFENAGPRSAGELVQRGSATYNGYAFAEVVETSDAIFGRTEIRALFSDGGTVDGEITDFALYDQTEVNQDPNSDALLTSNATPTQIDGALTLSGGAVSSVTQDGQSIGQISMNVSGSVTLPASESLTNAEEDFDVTGNIQARVTDNDFLAGFGFLDADSAESSLTLDTFILAQ
ncbi:MAG: hypothetical protein AAFP98_12830 [Pseudomonadota bacterium]